MEELPPRARVVHVFGADHIEESLPVRVAYGKPVGEVCVEILAEEFSRLSVRIPAVEEDVGCSVDAQ